MTIKKIKHYNDIVIRTKKGDHSFSKAWLKHVRSRVTSHEGELLTGSKGRNYMDKYSKKYLKKNLSGSYSDTRIK